MAYLSQSFNPAERNYEIYDRELLAIIRALEAWRHYLEGSPHPVRILTDHKNLTFFRSPQRLNQRQARWQLFLSQFNYILEHHAGTKLVQADAMTRMAAPADAKWDNNEGTLLPDDKFIATTVLPDMVFDAPILEVELCGGQIPTKGSEEAAGLDIRSTIDIVIPAHDRTIIPTGIKVRPPMGTYCRIAPRSGLAVKGIDVAAGVIDRDYTGEIKAILVNHTGEAVQISAGERIAQLVVEQIAYVKPQIVDQLSITTRGTDGFGSTGIHLIETCLPVHEQIKTELQDDPIAQEVITMLSNPSPTLLSKTLPFRSMITSWNLQDGLLFYQGQCYVPQNIELRRTITSQYHDTPSAGHPGQWRTAELIRRDYFWPGLQTFVSNYVRGCAACQQMKVNTHPTAPPLQPIAAKHRDRPFAFTTCDFITRLPESKGYNALMVVVDHDSTKGVILCPCTEKIDAIGTAKLYHKQVYRQFGLPDKFLTDRGPQFDSKVMKKLWRLSGTEARMSMAYHFQTDGQTERVNREIEAYLCIFCSSRPHAWADLITDMEFAFNNREHSATKYSPFFLMHGSHPRAISIAFPTTKVPSVQQWLLDRQKTREEANAAMDLATARMACRSNRNFTPFTKGQLVWLEMTNFQDGYPFRKLAPKRQGPFRIKEVLGKLVYRLDLRGQRKIHDVFHASLLTPYHETDQHGKNFIDPVPELINGHKEFEVHSILNHKTLSGHMHYLVRWKDQPQGENSWEPESHLKNAKEILETYKKEHNLFPKSPAKSFTDSATQNKSSQNQPTRSKWPLPPTPSPTSSTPPTSPPSRPPPLSPSAATPRPPLSRKRSPRPAATPTSRGYSPAHRVEDGAIPGTVRPARHSASATGTESTTAMTTGPRRSNRVAGRGGTS